MCLIDDILVDWWLQKAAQALWLFDLPFKSPISFFWLFILSRSHYLGSCLHVYLDHSNKMQDYIAFFDRKPTEMSLWTFSTMWICMTWMLPVTISLAVVTLFYYCSLMRFYVNVQVNGNLATKISLQTVLILMMRERILVHLFSDKLSISWELENFLI